jgi:2-dehydropantoate 2-reductase
MMRVLVVGAGAVGQVFGHHLARGGAEVAFLVKPRYAGAARAGYTLYALHDRRRRTTPIRFTGAGVVTSAAEAAASRWDAVILTVSSTALRGAWLAELAAATGDATVVMLQPGIDDRQVVLAAVAPDRVVAGLITLVSYLAPLPGETRFPEPGVAYFFPPLSAVPLSGPEARVRPLVDALRRGGMPARRHPDVGAVAQFPSALMTPFLLALEAGGWRMDRLGERAGVAARAAREAIAVARARGGKTPPLGGVLARGWLVRAGLAVGRRLVPFDLETYLRSHFTKVGDQTRLMLAQYIDIARERGLAASALEELRDAVPALAAGKEVAST